MELARFVADLRADHDLIESMLGSLRTFVEALRRGEADPGDGPRFARFFAEFGAWHHGREEDVLFPALVREAGLPERGPIASLRRDHEEMSAVLARLEQALARPAGPGPAAGEASDLAVRYSRALWSHIDAENSVILPESEARLRRAGVRELADGEPSPGTLHARAEAAALGQRYHPLVDREAMRGDGCIACPSFGNSCRGLEREWWNEYEWESLGEQD